MRSIVERSFTMPSDDRAVDDIEPYRTPAKVVPQPSKIVQICSVGFYLCALDDNGAIWVAALNSNKTLHFGGWQPAIP
jgi:hypothetical protein